MTFQRLFGPSNSCQYVLTNSRISKIQELRNNTAWQPQVFPEYPPVSCTAFKHLNQPSDVIYYTATPQLYF